METLLIEVDGRTLRFEQPRPIRIGRSIDADVVLPAMTVSRAHAELRPSGQGWVLADVGSGGGTFVDGVRIGQRPVTGPLRVQFGPPGPGSTIAITPEAMASGPLPTPTAVGAPPAPVAPGVPAAYRPPAAMPPAQGGVLPGRAAPPVPLPVSGAQPPVPSQWGPPADDLTRVPGAGGGVLPGAGVAMTGPDLLVVGGDREHRYRHPATVTIGRAADNNVVIADQACSRYHGRIVAAPGGWVYQNLSREGTYDDGRPVQQERVEETCRLRLGHPVAGPELAIIPVLSAQEEVRRAARKRQGRRLRLVAVIAAAALVVIAGSITTVAVARHDSDDAAVSVASQDGYDLPKAQRDHAKAATVLITYAVPKSAGGGEIIGSGSIIRSDGLILTNCHVAAPATPALKAIYGSAEAMPNPPYLEIHLTDPANGFKTGPPNYRAKVVKANGNLDAAVVQIYADGHGNPVDPSSLNLPTIPLGNSDALDTGDQVTILGFPGIARLTDENPLKVEPDVTVTTGVISTFVDTKRLGPDSEIDTDARIAPGNSGGAAVNDQGQLIGIPSSLASEASSPVVSGRIRPLSYLTGLISQAESEAR